MRGMGGWGKVLRRGWIHEGKGRRGANPCGEGGHMRGMGGGGKALRRGWIHEGEGRRGQILTERVDT